MRRFLVRGEADILTWNTSRLPVETEVSAPPQPLIAGRGENLRSHQPHHNLQLSVGDRNGFQEHFRHALSGIIHLQLVNWIAI
jgi:hypothetical protein